MLPALNIVLRPDDLETEPISRPLIIQPLINSQPLIIQDVVPF